jgi:hypothetical protein
LGIGNQDETENDKRKSTNKISFISPSPFDESYQTNFLKKPADYASILTGKSGVLGEYEKII